MTSPPQQQSSERKAPGLWSITAGFRARYGLAMLSMAVGILLMFLVPLITQQIIDGFPVARGATGPFEAPQWLQDLQSASGLAHTPTVFLILAATCVLLLTAISSAFQYLRGRLAAQACEGILRRLRTGLYQHLMDLPASYFDKADTGDLVQRCTSDVETVRLFLSAQVVEIGRAVLLLSCALPVLFYLNTNLAWVTIALTPIILLYSMFFFRRLTSVFLAADEAEGAMTSVLQENLTGIRVVRSFGRQEFEENKFEVANEAHRKKTLDLFRLLAWYWSVSDVLCLSQLGLVLFFGAYWTLDGDLSLGTMVAFSQYSALIIWPIRQMGRTLVDAGKARVSLKRLAEILEHPLEQETLVAGPPLTPPLKGGLRVRDLHFRFPVPEENAEANAEENAEENAEGNAEGNAEANPQTQAKGEANASVLNGINLDVNPGETLGLVGPPGSGKSTLMQLLLGLYDYRSPLGSGSIELDGHELASIDRTHLRAHMASVMQSPFLYAKSIQQNLLVGRGAAREDELYAATEAASLHASIVGFESGYQTLIGERGVTLSGGQKQRLAIARALLKNAPYLILDDSLSAVDHQTEEAILHALRQRSGKQTTMIISHRLSAVAHADQILVFREGHIVERGTHSQLLGQAGHYADLWRMQNQGPSQPDAQTKGAPLS